MWFKALFYFWYMAKITPLVRWLSFAGQDSFVKSITQYIENKFFAKYFSITQSDE